MANPNVFIDVLKRLRCWRLVRTSIQLFVPEREVLARAVEQEGRTFLLKPRRR